MKRKGIGSAAIGLVTIVCLCAGGAWAHADVLSIHQIQSTTSDGDVTVYDGQIHDVVGGVVTHIWHGFNDRVYLQDPAHDTWGGIMIKDRDGDLSHGVSLGDWVSLQNIYIQDYRGTTTLQYRRSLAPDVAFIIESSGNPVPDPIALTAADLPTPVHHAASEPYESMVVTLTDVVVGAKGLGKAEDNYELFQFSDIAWGADYMNVDAGAPYDPRIVPGARLDRVTGIVEQYTKLSSGWDYYQVITRSAGDIEGTVVTPVPAISGWSRGALVLLMACGLVVAFGRIRRSAA